MPFFRAIAVSSLATTLLVKKLAPLHLLFRSSFWTCGALFLGQLQAYILWICFFYPKFFSPLRRLPQPSGGNPFWGHFVRMLSEGSGDVMRGWLEEVPNDGLIRYLDIFNLERIAVVSPKGLAEVLVSKSYEFTKPPQMINGIGRIIGIGLFLAEGDEHKKQRKNLSPAFSFRHIKDLYPIFWAKSLELVDALSVYTELNSDNKSSDIIVDVGEWANRATLDIIGTAGLGHDFCAIKHPGNELTRTYRKIFTPNTRGKIAGMVSMFLPGWVEKLFPFASENDLIRASNTIKSVCKSLIEEKEQILNTSETKNSKDVDILSVAMQSGGFSTDDLVNHLMTFLAAGHETTASSLTWALCMLCQHPEMQTRLREEVQTHLNASLDRDTKTTITPHEIDNLPYLNAVTSEVLRLFPPVPLLFRVAAEDNVILGQHIPKGTAIILPPWAVNADKSLWGEDAAEFDPGRWMRPGTAHTGGVDSNYPFLTFLHGPRSCIGQGFAKSELACLLAAWVGTFETRFADPEYTTKVEHSMIVRPKDFQVKLKAV